MANHQRRDGRPASQVRDQLLDLLRQGQNVKDALQIVGRSRSWYEEQRRSDRDWAGLVDAIRQHVADPDNRQIDAGDFRSFAEKYLHRRIWPHQQNMVDLLEDREPSWLHPSMQYELGTMGSRRLLINIPPNHAKSMTITVEYVTYRLVKDPNISVIIVSKTQEMAKKMLYAIKQRLSHPRYADMQLAFAPPEGWKANSDQWSANKIYLGGDSRDSGEKDPSIEAIGMGGQIYGARANLIVLDDVTTLSNAGEWEKQMTWIRQEVASRLGPGGQLLVVGTRVAPIDLYRELLNEEHYADKKIPWTYLKMPAVLKYEEDELDWQTLWPVSDEPFVDDDQPDDDGNYPRWTGPRLASVRNEVGTARWALIYQQMDVEEEATFDSIAVRGSVNSKRKAGPLIPGSPGHPTHTEGFYTVCAMDPAIAGDCAAVAVAVDRQTNKRFVLDLQVITGPTPAQIRDLIRGMTELYTPHEWVIEENAFQGFLSQDEELNTFLANRGIVLKPHRTGSNKLDPEYGVASMSGLFGSVRKDGPNGQRVHQKDNLIELPNLASHGVRMLVEQLVTWSPTVKTKHRKQDTLMALWFAELTARRVISSTQRFNKWHMPNAMLSQRDRDRQMVVNLDELFEQRNMS